MEPHNGAAILTHSKLNLWCAKFIITQLCFLEPNLSYVLTFCRLEDTLHIELLGIVIK